MFEDQVVEAAETGESVVQQEVPTQQAPAEDVQVKNFRLLRESKERAERERDEMARRLREIEQQRALPTPEDENIHIAPDDLVEGKHLSKVDQKIKRLEDQLKRYQQEATVTTVESRIKSQYPDFDAVVSKENIEALRLQYPEIANTLNSSNDLYAKAVSAYTMIKRFGIAQDDMYQQERERAQRNASKPRPLSSVSPQQGESPLSRANAFEAGLTPELKAQLLKEMTEAKKHHY